MGLFGKNNRRSKTSEAGAGSRTGVGKGSGSRVYAIDHPELGEITVSRNPRAKRVSISIRPPGVVRLTLPVRVAEQYGIQFLESKCEWIIASLERTRRKTVSAPIAEPYSTRSHSLELSQADTIDIQFRIAAGRIIVTYPLALEYSDERVQDAIRRGIEEAWRIEAKELLPRRTAEIAQSLGLRYNSVRIRNTVSKWGSCSPRDDISLSLHLMRLPDELMDYIIIHELCHTVHKNHGPQFHALLDRCTAGRHLLFRKQLLTYTTRW